MRHPQFLIGFLIVRRRRAGPSAGSQIAVPPGGDRSEGLSHCLDVSQWVRGLT